MSSSNETMNDKSTITFQVIISDPRANERGYRKAEVDSTHSTMAEADARCREIVLKELSSRQALGMSLAECVNDYSRQCSIPHVRPSDGSKKVFYEHLPRQWKAQELARDWPGLMARIAEVPPEIPRSWFRWLHWSFLSRNKAAVHLELNMEWESVAHVVEHDASRLDDALLKQIEAHSWEIGRCGLHRLAEACWQRLSPDARGRILAGISDVSHLLDLDPFDFNAVAQTDPDVRHLAANADNWIMERLSDVSLTAEGVLELACNAIRRQSEKLLSEVVRLGAHHWNDTILRMEAFEQGWSHEGHHADDVKRLSHRLIDMVLEASVLRGYLPGARMALSAGANVNLRIWALERNSAEDHMALSFAIAEHGTELINLLLQAGASPLGDGTSKCLYLAVTKDDYALVDRLLAAGATFDQGEKPEWLAKSVPGDDIERERCMSFNCHYENIELAQQLGCVLPLVHASEAAWFFRGGGQGGRYSTMLSHFLYHDDVARLQHYVSKGLPLRMTLPDLSTALGWGAYDCLTWMMQQWNTPPSFMLKVRREIPDFGTNRRAWMVRADARRIGLLESFDTQGLEPFLLPDAGRLWVDLSGIASQDIQLGPVWTRTTNVEMRRRRDAVVLREVSHEWELKPVPVNDHQLRNLLPVIKEIGGVFLYTGLTLGTLWWQDYPGDWKDRVNQWVEGEAWTRLRPKVIERAAQNVPENTISPK